MKNKNDSTKVIDDYLKTIDEKIAKIEDIHNQVVNTTAMNKGFEREMQDRREKEGKKNRQSNALISVAVITSIIMLGFFVALFILIGNHSNIAMACSATGLDYEQVEGQNYTIALEDSTVQCDVNMRVPTYLLGII